MERTESEEDFLCSWDDLFVESKRNETGGAQASEIIIILKVQGGKDKKEREEGKEEGCLSTMNHVAASEALRHRKQKPARKMLHDRCNSRWYYGIGRCSAPKRHRDVCLCVAGILSSHAKVKIGSVLMIA